MAAPQQSSQTEEILSLRSSGRACSPALGKEAKRFHIFQEIFSVTESTFLWGEGPKVVGVSDFGVYSIMKKSFFCMGRGKGVLPNALPICVSRAFVQ